MSDALSATRDRVFVGIVFVSFAYFFFTVHDAAVKILVVAIPVWQILFFRSVTILAGCGLSFGRNVYGDAWRSPVFRPMLFRSFLIFASWLCFYTAARDLQLAELTTIYFAAPIIVTVLSVLILKEKVPLSRWLAVVIGFVGVYFACNPASLGFSRPVLLVLTAAFGWGLAIVLMRKIALQEKSVVQMVLNNGFFLITAGVPSLFMWQMPSWWQAMLLVVTGAVAGFAQFTLYEGMKRAPASVIAPFEYTSLVWAFVLGYALWSDVPRPEVVVGAVLIVGAGLLTIVGEHRRQKRFEKI